MSIKSVNLAAAREWAQEPAVQAFFAVEIRNERNGGASPATLRSAIDSLTQAPDDVLAEWFDAGDGRGPEPLRGLVVLLAIASRVPDTTPLAVLS